MPLSVTFWGTRGSLPTPGPGTVRYGGNTACLTVANGQGQELVLDAGSGIRSFGRHLVGRRGFGPGRLSIVLSHTHWDHIQGLPFFEPLYQPGHEVRIFGPKQPTGSLERVLRSQMEPAVFPVPLGALGATLSVTEITPGPFELPGFRLAAVGLCHPGTTVGYSIATGTSGMRVTYMTDNELGAPAAKAGRPELVRFLQDTTTLIHDAMYTTEEVVRRVGWGHSSAAEATALALEAGVRRLVLFHHDPDHDDRALDRLLDEAHATHRRLGGDLEIEIATEGTTLHLEDRG